MNIPITARLYQIPETGQIGGEQMQNTHGYHGNVPFAHSHQNVMTANGYVPYQEGNQIYPNDYTSSGNFTFQNNHNMLNPCAPHPAFHNTYAYTTFIQNHTYQPQTNQGGFYNPTQPALTPYAPGVEKLIWNSLSLPGAAQEFAPPKNQISDSNKRAPLHSKTGKNSIATIPKKASYRCSNCKQMVVKVILKKKGPNNWLCVQCYNRHYNFTGYQKCLFDKMVRNDPAF